MTQLISVGQKAPDFTLTDTNGNKFHLFSFMATSEAKDNFRETTKPDYNQKQYKKILLYFYPRDNTPGCTIQAKNFNQLSEAYEQQSTKIVGISTDGQQSHQNFSSKLCLSFDLLCDTEHEVAEKYGVWQEKRMFLKKYMGIVRSSFLINCSDMMVEMVWSPVKGVISHGNEVLTAIAQP